MWIVIGEISICLVITLIFGLIMGWYLAVIRKNKELDSITTKYLEGKQQINSLKKEIKDCRYALLSKNQ